MFLTDLNKNIKYFGIWHFSHVKNFFPKSTNSNLGYAKILVQKHGVVKKGKGV